MRVVLGNMHGNNADVEAESSLLHRMLRGSLDSLEEPCLVNRNPRWNAKARVFFFFLVVCGSSAVSWPHHLELKSIHKTSS